MKKLIAIIFLLLIFGCLPKPPRMKTVYGEDCLIQCRAVFAAGSMHSIQELRECYKTCQTAEEMRLKAYSPWIDKHPELQLP